MGHTLFCSYYPSSSHSRLLDSWLCCRRKPFQCRVAGGRGRGRCGIKVLGRSPGTAEVGEWRNEHRTPPSQQALEFRKRVQPALANNSNGANQASPIPVAISVSPASSTPPSAPPTNSSTGGVDLRFFLFGMAAAVGLHTLLNFFGSLPAVRRIVKKFIWWRDGSEELRTPLLTSPTDGEKMDAEGEPVEWVNMCWRKAWRVYQRGLERWIADLLQPVFDNLVLEGTVPRFVQRLRIMEFTLDHDAPYFTNMRRRSSRKDSDLTGVVDVRYTGGARMLLLLECGTGRWRIKIPVMVTDLDLECTMWIKLRLAPMCPYVGTLSLAFVGPPTVKVQLSPYNRVQLMRIPILQPFLTKFFTIDLPALMTLPQRLEINIPPAVTAVAEAAVGRDAVMRAVASAVLQADALEHALLSALPLGPQGAAGGVSLPDLFQGELQVVLKEARDLPVWGFPWQSNPYARLVLGNQAVRSRRDSETSQASRHRAPVWNQEFQFLVEDPSVQKLEIFLRDSPMTGRTDVGRAILSLIDLPKDGAFLDVWLQVESLMPGEGIQGAVHVSASYKQFQDDEEDSGYREAAAYRESVLGSLGEDQYRDDDGADVEIGGRDDEEQQQGSEQRDEDSLKRRVARLASAEGSVTERQQNLLPGSSVQQQPAVLDGETTQKSRPSFAVRDLTSWDRSGIIDIKSAADASSRAAVAASAAAAAVAVTKAAAARAAARLARNNSKAELEDNREQQSQQPPQQPQNVTEDLAAMTATMEMLTTEVRELNAVAKEKKIAVQAAESAAKTVAAAEALAIAAVAAGDVHKANEALQDAAVALELTADTLATSSLDKVVETMSDNDTDGADISFGDAIDVEQVENGDATDAKASDGGQPWWSRWVKRPFASDSIAKDGGVGGVVLPEKKSDQELPVGDIIISPDIPIEAIAAEVQKSWKLRDRHVQVLVQKALESRQRESERPWLVVIAVMATASAILLSIVLYRLSTLN